MMKAKVDKKEQSLALQDDLILMDMTCPLMRDPDYWDWWLEGGVDVAAPSVQGDNIRDTIKDLAWWLKMIRLHDDKFLHVTSVEDIYRAKREKKLGIIFHFQGTSPIETDIDMLEVYYRLGVRVIQLTYNVKNRVGNGCEERSDDGLSNFGIRVIREMNRLGMVVDCAHTGIRTSFEAIEHSERPVVVSHANARALCDSDRNLPDDLIKAIVQQGGLTGLVGFPSFVRRDTPRPTLDDLFDHCDYICQLTGTADGVAIGIDYYEGMSGVSTDREAQTMYEKGIAAGMWNPHNYPPPPHHFPKGLDNPSMFANFPTGLQRRGYSDDDIRKICGGNWIRVLEAHG